MNKIITKSVKVAVVAGTLAATLTGCCMFGSDDCCGKKDCCCKDPCACCCKKECCGKKTSGVNTSMTVGVGTDGVRVGSDSNVGGVSANANAGVGANGVTAGAGGGVN